MRHGYLDVETNRASNFSTRKGSPMKSIFYIDNYTDSLWFRFSKDEILWTYRKAPNEDNIYDGDDVFLEKEICFDKKIESGKYIIYAYYTEGEFVALDSTKEIIVSEISVGFSLHFDADLHRVVPSSMITYKRFTDED